MNRSGGVNLEESTSIPSHPRVRPRPTFKKKAASSDTWRECSAKEKQFNRPATRIIYTGLVIEVRACSHGKRSNGQCDRGLPGRSRNSERPLHDQSTRQVGSACGRTRRYPENYLHIEAWLDTSLECSEPLNEQPEWTDAGHAVAFLSRRSCQTRLSTGAQADDACPAAKEHQPKGGVEARGAPSHSGDRDEDTRG
ncbi:uncharacterized protein B0I36DRAFT_356215 [Microdochium trichocladiopsis]|uniref:Uncharacterized protein n=1 Tax=Microdochium trichocladiopsis TaxID=1682393 RepID=A0A9P8XQS5_9PEZI|nr:uncharacterized protein B0I36DRAFT_356215 [Microdochium trichocladiopsis]KAH7012117.1 hypothetical protein B0I36DRAFT_356215 [Microdochium trichocladiopsis]